MILTNQPDTVWLFVPLAGNLENKSQFLSDSRGTIKLMASTQLTLWTIRIACLLLVVGLFGLPVANISRGNRWLRVCWTIGCGLALLHFICAFQFYHDWSHSAAVRDTAEQTEQLLGIRFGGGLYFNYLFLLVWIGDTLWWWIDPEGYAKRRKIVNLFVYGYLAFIAFNGAVVFVTGPTRWIGAAITAALVARWIILFTQRPDARLPAN
jgi:hypothetical protein